MRYLGSKSSTATTIEKRATKIFGETSTPRTVCDPFGGIGMVAAAFKRAGWQVTVADHLLFPHYYQRARLASSRWPNFRRLRTHLQLASTSDIEVFLREITPSPGWITREYSKKRAFFTRPNAVKIDAAWSHITAWRSYKLISEHEYAFLISSLIDSLDKVANTAGTYYAHLKDATRRALNEFEFRFLAPVIGAYDAHCLRQDAVDTVSARQFDVLYLDPPYSSRAYDRYYHLPQSIAASEQIKPVGVSGVPARLPIRSEFESPRSAERAFENLIDAARCSVLIVQYADGGLIDLDRIRKILSSRGKVRHTRIATIGYTTQSRSRSTHHSLFVVTDA